MNVRVDQLKCDTSGICVMESPELFRFQAGSKKAMTLVDEAPPALEQTVIRMPAVVPPAP